MGKNTAAMPPTNPPTPLSPSPSPFPLTAAEQKARRDLAYAHTQALQNQYQQALNSGAFGKSLQNMQAGQLFGSIIPPSGGVEMPIQPAMPNPLPPYCPGAAELLSGLGKALTPMLVPMVGTSRTVPVLLERAIGDARNLGLAGCEEPGAAKAIASEFVADLTTELQRLDRQLRIGMHPEPIWDRLDGPGLSPPIATDAALVMWFASQMGVAVACSWRRGLWPDGPTEAALDNSLSACRRFAHVWTSAIVHELPKRIGSSAPLHKPELGRQRVIDAYIDLMVQAANDLDGGLQVWSELRRIQERQLRTAQPLEMGQVVRIWLEGSKGVMAEAEERHLLAGAGAKAQTRAKR